MNFTTTERGLWPWLRGLPILWLLDISTWLSLTSNSTEKSQPLVCYCLYFLFEYCSWSSILSSRSNPSFFCQKIQQKHSSNDNVITKQVFHAFLFNIRNNSPEVSNIQRRKTELNITLLRVKNFEIKQKRAWNICFIIYPRQQTKSLLSIFFFIKRIIFILIQLQHTGTTVLNYLILIVVIIFFRKITQPLWIIISKSIKIRILW